MRLVIIAAILLLAFVTIEVQILGIHEDIKKDKCSRTELNGTIHQSTEYEYYSCLANGGR